MLIAEGILLELKFIQGRQALFCIIIIERQEIRNRVIPVLEPGEKQPVHNIRIPVTFRYGSALKQEYMFRRLYGQLRLFIRTVSVLEKRLAFLDDIVKVVGGLPV